MKRLTLIIVLVAAVGLASGFALEVKPSFELSGSASMTWGVDLDNMDTGFKNSSDADLTITLMAEGSEDTHAGKGPVYGSITLSDLELYWVDGVMYVGGDKVKAGYDWATNDDETTIAVDPSIEAHLVFGNFDLGIFDHPDMNSEGAPAIEDGEDSYNDIIDAILIEEPAFTFGAFDSNQGTYLKYNMGDNWFKVDFVSRDAWDDAATKNEYAAGAEASMTFAPITVGAGVFQGITWAPNATGGYATLALDLTGIGSAKAGFDWQLGTPFLWDVFGQADMYFNADKTAYLEAKLFYEPGATNLDSALYFMVPADTLFGAVNADLAFFALDLTTAAKTIGAEAHLGYTLKLANGMKVAPTAFVDFTSVGPAPSVNTLLVGPQVVVTLAEAPDTTFTLAYTSGNLLATTIGMGEITAGLEVTY